MRPLRQRMPRRQRGRRPSLHRLCRYLLDLCGLR